jgi:hypothetical protein
LLNSLPLNVPRLNEGEKLEAISIRPITEQFIPQGTETAL